VEGLMMIPKGKVLLSSDEVLQRYFEEHPEHNEEETNEIIALCKRKFKAGFFWPKGKNDAYLAGEV
jgi:hypothetical protein